MPLITWSDTLSVKVQQFDDHHKKLIELINQLFNAMMGGKGKDV